MSTIQEAREQLTDSPEKHSLFPPTTILQWAANRAGAIKRDEDRPTVNIAGDAQIFSTREPANATTALPGPLVVGAGASIVAGIPKKHAAATVAAAPREAEADPTAKNPLVQPHTRTGPELAAHDTTRGDRLEPVGADVDARIIKVINPLEHTKTVPLACFREKESAIRESCHPFCRGAPRGLAHVGETVSTRGRATWRWSHYD
jgi:hypothetical protein